MAVLIAGIGSLKQQLTKYIPLRFILRFFSSAFHFRLISILESALIIVVTAVHSRISLLLLVWIMLMIQILFVIGVAVIILIEEYEILFDFGSIWWKKIEFSCIDCFRFRNVWQLRIKFNFSHVFFIFHSILAHHHCYSFQITRSNHPT